MKSKTVITKENMSSLASKVVWALKYLDTKSGSGMMVTTDPEAKSFKTIAWQEDFMDVLDKVGIVVDRPKYYEQKYSKKKTECKP